MANGTATAYGPVNPAVEDAEWARWSAARSAGRPADLGGVIADLVAVAAQVSERSAGEGREPDPSAVAAAIAEGRGQEARVGGEALALRVLAEALSDRRVLLALEVLRGGPHSARRILELCEVFLPAALASAEA